MIECIFVGDGNEIQTSQQKIATSIARSQGNLLKNKLLEIDYQKELLFKKCFLVKEEDGKTLRVKHSDGKKLKILQHLDAADIIDSQQRLARVQDQNSIEVSRSRWLRFKQVLISYSLLACFSLLHIGYTIVINQLHDPMERRIWPFTHIANVSHFSWAVLAWSVAIVIWTFVYGAMTTACLLAEDIDEIKDLIRKSILEEAHAPCEISPNFTASRYELDFAPSNCRIIRKLT